ncbi:MAG: CocE/NonD family hydrolase [Candidatus Latescibacteria bacterium]|nr:CocE/NonD family hydrolase [Candidatus Latescibacterota bacterium]
MRILINRRVPSEDGVALATDVYMPSGAGPFPTVLVRTPYHRIGQQSLAPLFVKRGYALVVQDCRGKYDSDGVFSPLRDEARDGHAAVDWVANQRWCNGRVGLWGRSYLGIVQVPAASGGHESIRCIVPSVAPGSFFEDWIRYDGCFALSNAIRWSLSHASCRNKPPERHIDWEALNFLASPAEITEAVGFETACLADWADNDANTDYWQEIDQKAMHAAIKVPGYHAGGWFDHLTRGQFNAFRNIRDHGATASARAGQRLLIGPWGHKNVGNNGAAHTSYGAWDFGAETDLSVMDHELQCLDHYLKDLDNGYENQPTAKVFLMGANRWMGFDDWPPPDQDELSWYLNSAGSANMRIGDGTLSMDSPGQTMGDTIVYDPKDPVPTCGGAIYWGLEPFGLGPADQRSILARPDVLYYRSEPVTARLAVVGEIILDLILASSAEDTDVIAKLCVEQSDGTVMSLTVGSLRCRYRDDAIKPEPLVPGEATKMTIHLNHVAYEFPVGSRISLIITSSDFPRILPHRNTLSAPWSGEEIVVARNTVLHGPDAVSCLKLPVIDVGA